MRRVLEAVMSARAVPGFVIAVGRGDGPPEHLVIGADGAGTPLSEDSHFPIASVTKLATALTVLRLDWPVLSRACLATPLMTPPGTAVRYSNVGIGLLAVVIERLTGQAFPEAMADIVLEPLGIEAYLGDEPARPPAWIAGDLGEHTGTELDPCNPPFSRRLAMP